MTESHEENKDTSAQREPVAPTPEVPTQGRITGKRREAIFQLEEVQVSYGPKPAVRGVSFDIGKNEITALPIQIFDWISRASNDVNNYKPLAAAAILLLMIMLVLMNSIAIWLRNRYEQKW